MQTSGALRQESKCNGGSFGTISKIKGENGIKLQGCGAENGTRWRADENNQTERDGVYYKRSGKCTVQSIEVTALQYLLLITPVELLPSVRTKNPIAVRLITVFKISTFASC